METLLDNKLVHFTADIEGSKLQIPASLEQAAQLYLFGKDFPTTKSERFKYTRLAKLANAAFSSQELTNAVNNSKGKIITDAYTIVIDNLAIALPSDLPATIEISSIADSNIAYHPASFKDVFGALNVLHAQQGVSIRIRQNTTLEKPIQIIQVHSGGKNFYRHHLQFEANCEANLYFVSLHTEGQTSFAHSHYQYEIAKDARIKIFKIQDAESGHFDFNEDRGYQADRAHFEINTLTLSGNFVRNDAQITILGEHAQTYLNGAYWLKDEQHVANYTTIDHQVANCESFETYKGVAADKATAVFNGKVFVRKDAQKTNAYQSNANVLLSDNASVNSKPELEIYADDVKCSHGSTTGQLDENALFYLRARGLSEAAAKNLLLQAFMEDVLAYVKNEEVLSYVHQRISERFNWTY